MPAYANAESKVVVAFKNAGKFNQDAGTVDYLREVAPGREGGACIRAVPRPGSVIVMTLPLLADVDPADTTATLSRELTALVSLIEQR